MKTFFVFTFLFWATVLVGVPPTKSRPRRTPTPVIIPRTVTPTPPIDETKYESLYRAGKSLALESRPGEVITSGRFETLRKAYVLELEIAKGKSKTDQEALLIEAYEEATPKLRSLSAWLGAEEAIRELEEMASRTTGHPETDKAGVQARRAEYEKSYAGLVIALRKAESIYLGKAVS